MLVEAAVVNHQDLKVGFYLQGFPSLPHLSQILNPMGDGMRLIFTVLLPK